MRILLAADEPDRSGEIRDFLEPRGADVIFASTLEGALAALEGDRFDVVLADVDFPGDALELLGKLRANPRQQKTPVLMLVGERAAEEGQIAMRMGANAYIARRASKEAFQRRLRGVLQNAKEPGIATKKLWASALSEARILAIDDSADYLATLAGVLEIEGCRVTLAAGGREGLSAIASDSYDCVIVDLRMPDVDGIQVCRAIDALRKATNDPLSILMLTGHETPADMAEALMAGADDFATKASDTAVLLARIRALLRRKYFYVEMERMIDELADAKLQAERASAEKTTFLAHTTHELRTPLNAIIGYTELILEQAADLGSIVPDLERIRSAGGHLLTLIGGLLDLAKIESGRVDLTIAPVDVKALVAEVMATVRPLSDANNNTLIAECEGVAPLETDETKLRQALLNLVSNACKFTKNGRVSIEVRPEGRHLLFAVADTGIGMSPEQIHRLFKPYSQGDASIGRQYGGTGLGLLISQKYCELLGGNITVESEPKKGSTFRMRLPARARPR